MHICTHVFSVYPPELFQRENDLSWRKHFPTGDKIRNLIQKDVFPIGYLIYLPVLIIYHTSIKIYIPRRDKFILLWFFSHPTSIFFPREIIFSKDFFFIVNNISLSTWDTRKKVLISWKMHLRGMRRMSSWPLHNYPTHRVKLI